MSEVELAFEELFYGAGSWLGILLLLALIVALSERTKYVGVCMLPVALFLGIDYLSQDTPLVWHALIMFFASVFIVIRTVKSR